MHATDLSLHGCYLLTSDRFFDERGDFTKIFHAPSFTAKGLESNFPESYVTTSKRGVIRGLHFQKPPADHAKIVRCLAGRARDVLLDLRRASPTFGLTCVQDLDGDASKAVYVPHGVAHGFSSLQDATVMLYMVSSTYDATRDTGILWSSVSVDWWNGECPSENVISRRDLSLPKFSEFDTPF